IIAGHCGLDPIERDGLREIGHGHWEGMKRDDVERQFGSEYVAWEADPFTFAPAGGESGVAVLARAAGDPRDRRRASGDPGAGRLTQGHAAVGAEQSSRLRSARLPGSPGP